jgi:hypothetical protein
VLSPAFSAIVAYGQELMPVAVEWCRDFSLAWPSAWVASALQCWVELADWTSIEFVYRVCSFLPMIGLLTYPFPTWRSHPLLRASHPTHQQSRPSHNEGISQPLRAASAYAFPAPKGICIRSLN